MIARQVWTHEELLNLARALAVGMNDDQRQGAALLLLAAGVDPHKIARALGMTAPDYRGGTPCAELLRRR